MDHPNSEIYLTAWNAALEAAVMATPGGDICDPQTVADAIRALRSPHVSSTTPGEPVWTERVARIAGGDTTNRTITVQLYDPMLPIAGVRIGDHAVLQFTLHPITSP